MKNVTNKYEREDMNSQSKIVVTCPVCNGRGLVPAGFYNINSMSPTTSISPIKCMSCKGKGIIISNHKMQTI